MTFILLTCTDCDQTNEIKCDGDLPLMCPECRSVDEFESEESEDVQN